VSSCAVLANLNHCRRSSWSELHIGGPNSDKKSRVTSPSGVGTLPFQLPPTLCRGFNFPALLQLPFTRYNASTTSARPLGTIVNITYRDQFVKFRLPKRSNTASYRSPRQFGRSIVVTCDGGQRKQTQKPNGNSSDMCKNLCVKI